MVGSSGVLLARVVDVKAYSDAKPFVVLDAGMTELLRPALYGAYHRIEPVTPRPGALRTCDVVGPLCESSDVVGQRPATSRRSRSATWWPCSTPGAYGSTMAFTYNRRPLPCEALVDDGAWQIIRRRQTIDDLLALERATGK